MPNISKLISKGNSKKFKRNKILRPQIVLRKKTALLREDVK